VRGTYFADDTGVALPRNIRFDSNTFYVNAGSVSGRGRYVQVTNNWVYGYYWTTGGGGGAIEQETCADQVRITGNMLYGNWEAGSTGPSGMELYSRNLTVSGNTVSGYANEGIGIFSVYSAAVTGNHVYNNNLCYGTDPGCGNNPDIKIATRFPWPGTCHPGGNTCDADRDVQGLTVTGNDSASQAAGKVQYGIFFDACCDGSTDNVTGDVVSGNSLSVTGVVVACDPHVSANTCPPSTQTGGIPHTIAPFPEGSPPLGAPLGANDPSLRVPPPPNERYFRFGANDPGGPGNLHNYYASIQVIFDAVTNPNQPDPGFGGPYGTQAACHFAYYPGFSLVYLDAPSANFSWTGGSSVVGSGGGLLDNGICVINAGNSTHSTGQQYVELVLDIAFHQTGTWYMYEIATNNTSTPSGTNQLGPNGNPISPWSIWGYWPVTIAQ